MRTPKHTLRSNLPKSGPDNPISAREAQIYRYFWRLFYLLLAVLTGMAIWDGLMAWTERPIFVYSRTLIYWLSWLSVPLLAAVWLIYRQRRISGPVALLMAAVLGIHLYAFVIEPNRLVVREQSWQPAQGKISQPLRFAVVSDIHVGLYSNRWQMHQLAERLNQLEVDAVLMPGDFTYETPQRDLLARLAPLGNVRHPMFYTLGNHDEEAPGPPLTDDLIRALDQLGLTNLEQRETTFKGLQLMGTGDLWAQRVQLGRVSSLRQRGPVLVLAHNPDSIDLIEPVAGASVLMISGHTHGGQIRLPWLTERILKSHSVHGYVRGFYQQPQAEVFVTAGTGVVGIPYRLGVPPVIDILNISSR